MSGESQSPRLHLTFARIFILYFNVVFLLVAIDIETERSAIRQIEIQFTFVFVVAFGLILLTVLAVIGIEKKLPDQEMFAVHPDSFRPAVEHNEPSLLRFVLKQFKEQCRVHIQSRPFKLAGYVIIASRSCFQQILISFTKG